MQKGNVVLPLLVVLPPLLVLVEPLEPPLVEDVVPPTVLPDDELLEDEVDPAPLELALLPAPPSPFADRSSTDVSALQATRAIPMIDAQIADRVIIEA